MAYRLLDRFRSLFDGTAYKHRSSTLGDSVAQELYEDLVGLGRSIKIVERVRAQSRVLNTQNRTVGIKARRGDGTFGEVIPAAAVIVDAGFVVGRGPIAAMEIGAETKILAKAMIKQVDRVIGDLQRQAAVFREKGLRPICIGIVGVNHAARYTSFEGERAYTTDGGGGYRHPSQEAPEAERRLLSEAAPVFDEFLLLRFKATNAEPYPFDWVDTMRTEQEYGAALTRISIEYDRRF